MKVRLSMCTAVMCVIGTTATVTADAARAGIRPLASRTEIQGPPAPQSSTTDDQKKKKPKPPGGISPKPGGTRRTTGTVTAVSGDSISITTADSRPMTMTFTIDKDTAIVTKGASSKAASEKSGHSIPITDFVKEGATVRIDYAVKRTDVRAAQVVVVKGGI